MPARTRIKIQEVQNYGGFFGGDTVSLTAIDLAGGDDILALTIDAAALANVAERHRVLAGMIMELEMAGPRVERAELLGAASREELRAALGAPVLPDRLDGPLIVSYHCDNCAAWMAGQPDGLRCRVCGSMLA